MRNILIFLLLFCTLYASDLPKYSLCDKSDYKPIKNHKGQIYTKKGDFATISPFKNDNETAWAKRFGMVEMGGVDDSHITKKLLKQKDLLSVRHRLGYDWMPAFYFYTDGHNRDFVKWLYKNRNTTTLNPNGPFIHCKKNGYDWCKDYFYDWGYEEIIDKRVEDLSKNLKRSGFNGVFFDWASGNFIKSDEFKSMSETFKKRHPKKNYFEQVGKFYNKLKKRGIFFVTNQAFRNDKYLLKYITYDMTESYITTDSTKKIKIQIKGKGWIDSVKVTNYYPIYKNSSSIKDSLHFINVLTTLKQKYTKHGFKNFIYMNYIAPKYIKIYPNFPLYKIVKPKNAIYFSYAMAKLTNNIEYAEIPDMKEFERDEIYFYDLGTPYGKNYSKLKDLDIYVRFFKNGFVLVSEAYHKDIYLQINSSFIPKNRMILDAYRNDWIKSDDNGTTVVKLHFEKGTFSKKPLPLGRVYLYEKRD